MVAVKNFFVWMLIAWVASGPSALAWHHALEHSGIENHSAGCCSAESPLCSESSEPESSCELGNTSKLSNTSGESSSSCISVAETVCPFGFAYSDTTDSDCLSAEDVSLTSTVDRSNKDECRICEILLHSDAAVYGDDYLVSFGVAWSTGDEVAVSRPFKRWFGTWSVRGPPSC
jgi:hypothetical protein